VRDENYRLRESKGDLSRWIALKRGLGTRQQARSSEINQMLPDWLEKASAAIDKIKLSLEPTGGEFDRGMECNYKKGVVLGGGHELWDGGHEVKREDRKAGGMAGPEFYEGAL